MLKSLILNFFPSETMVLIKRLQQLMLLERNFALCSLARPIRATPEARAWQFQWQLLRLSHWSKQRQSKQAVSMAAFTYLPLVQPKTEQASSFNDSFHLSPIGPAKNRASKQFQ